MRYKILITLAAAAFLLDPFGTRRAEGAASIPNVPLTTHEGRTVRFFDDLVKGKIVAIDLIYTTCQYACPLETARLAQVQRLLGDRMGRDVFFYSITIDPEHDTPAVLADYARKYHAGPGWLFLTGAKADIDLLSKKLGLYTPPDPSNPDGHAAYLLVGNEATGQWMRNSATDNPKFIARTIGEWLDSWRAPASERLASSAEPVRITITRGEYAFAYHCSACHTIGEGVRIGPDLDGVTSRRDDKWLRRFITAPETMNAEGDPIARSLRAEYRNARMPNLSLSDEDVSAVIDYLERESRTRAAASPPPASPQTGATAATPAAVNAVLDPYFRIQRALYTDTLDGVADAARAIAAAAGSGFGSTAGALSTSAAQLEQAADIKSARAAFGALSDAVIACVRASRVDRGDVGTVFCPMAQKYWLQTGNTVKNPYFGRAMPDCGRFVR